MELALASRLAEVQWRCRVTERGKTDSELLPAPTGRAKGLLMAEQQGKGPIDWDDLMSKTCSDEEPWEGFEEAFREWRGWDKEVPPQNS